MSSNPTSIPAPSSLGRRIRDRLPGGLFSNRLVSDGLWVTVGQVFAAISLLAGTRVLTELVAPSIFGAVSLLLGLVSLVTGVFCLPQLHAASRFFPELARAGKLPVLRATIGGKLQRIVGLVALALVVTGCLIQLVWNQSLIAFALLAALISIEVWRSFEQDLLTAARRQKACSIWQAAESVVKPLAAILLVLLLTRAYGFEVASWQVLLGYLIGSGLVLLWFSWRLQLEGGHGQTRHERPPNIAVDQKFASEVRRYAMPLMPLAVVAWLNAAGDRYLIGGLAGEAAVGIYAAAYGMISQGFSLACGRILTLIFRPIFFQAVADNNQLAAKRALKLWLLMAILVCSVSSLLIFLLADTIAAWLLAPAYADAARVMGCLSIAFGLMAISHIYNTINLAYKRTRYVFLSEASAAVSMVICGVPLIYMFALKGAAIATCLAYAVQLATAFSLSKPLHHTPEIRTI